AFSEAGDLLRPRRSKLRPDIIAATQCDCSYKRLGFKRSSMGASGASGTSG
ncbi:hypothetical protein AOQ84DRAFT_353670, partial [Glonium stellatum]